MEEILSSIKRIIAEDKAVDAGEPVVARKKIAKPALKAVPDVIPEEMVAKEVVPEEEVLELTEEVQEEHPNEAHGVFGDRRKVERLIDDEKLDSMRQTLSSLVAGGATEQKIPANPAQGTSLEDLTRELMRPMLKQWLDNNLPDLVEELVAREIRRISEK